MHEYSIVTSLIAAAEARAREYGATAIRRVSVDVGDLSGVDRDLLATAYELARDGTMCGRADLVVRAIPVAWRCRGCGQPVPPGEVLQCRACGQPARLVSGDEIVLAQLELEVVDV